MYIRFLGKQKCLKTTHKTHHSFEQQLWFGGLARWIVTKRSLLADPCL
jgi:hypothetical protein